MTSPSDDCLHSSLLYSCKAYASRSQTKQRECVAQVRWVHRKRSTMAPRHSMRSRLKMMLTLVSDKTTTSWKTLHPPRARPMRPPPPSLPLHLQGVCSLRLPRTPPQRGRRPQRHLSPTGPLPRQPVCRLAPAFYATVLKKRLGLPHTKFVQEVLPV
jgi:hypothetical protein